VVARSVTWQNVQIGERAFVDSSIVTSNASVAADTVVTGLVRTPARRERNPFSRARLWLRKDATPGIMPTPAVS
jgi:ADP-glucose pyrophosphorylase